MEAKLTGRDLKAERVRVGLTQRELAARLGVSRQRVRNVEEAFRPSSTFSRRYLDALGLEAPAPSLR